MIDYEMVRKFFADKLAADFAGHGRLESAFYHTIKMVYDTVSAQYTERIEELQRTVKTLGEALVTTGEGNAELLAEREKLVTRMAHLGCVNGALRSDSEELARLKHGRGEPVAWIRFCSDGGYEGPIMNSQIEDARKASGAWTPLYPAESKASKETT